jgi:hypothetical protein
MPSAAEPSAVEEPARVNPGQDARDAGGVDAVLSRLVRSGVWRNDSQPAPEIAGDGSLEEQEEAQAEEPAPQAPAPAAGHAASAEHHDEESIESYMQRLLQRVGVTPSTAQAPPVAKPAQANWQPVQPVEEPVAFDAEQAADDQPESKPEEFVPRSAAPEATNMAAMRELANSAARTAIDKHQRKNTGKQAAGKLVGSLIVLACSLVLAYWAWRTSETTATVGAAIGLTAGTYWSLQSIGRMFRAARPKKVKKVPISIAPPDVPAEPGPPQG